MPATDPPSPLTAARDTAVACDLSAFAVLAIEGPDAAAFLQGQLSNDIAALLPGTLQYTSYNSPGGRMLANFVLWRDGPEHFRALLPAGIAAAVARRLGMFVLRAKVKVADISATVACFGVGGPGAGDALLAALGALPTEHAALRHGDATLLAMARDRIVVVAPAASADATRAALAGHAVPADAAVWQWLLIRAGVPVVTAATQDKFVPQTANWDVLGGISFRKGCYTGQEIVARTQYLGRLKERAGVFRTEAPAVAPGDRLYSPVFDDQPCGTVVNAAPAPDGGIEFVAVVQLAAAASGTLALGAPGGPPVTPLPLPYALPDPVATPRPGPRATRS